jgi:dihydroorotate dehydrogenase
MDGAGRNLYDLVGRPVFLSMGPERAHRVATSLLGLPLPWSRIGGVPAELGDPATSPLATTLVGIPLAHPVGLAAGFDKTLAHLDALGSLGFGFVVGGTITRAARLGNPSPRIHRYPARGAIVNAMGLPNPGAEPAAATLARTLRTVPRFVSVADEDVPDAVTTLALLEPHADGFELNASCPNVSWGRDRNVEDHLGLLVRALRARTAKPLLVKLPPFDTGPAADAVLALARLSREAGADGVVVGNTRPVADAHLAVGTGGLSGAPLWPRTADAVAEVREATGEGFAIVACGGIAEGAQVRACLDAGAVATQLYTGLVYRGPGIVGRIVRDLVLP